MRTSITILVFVILMGLVGIFSFPVLAAEDVVVEVGVVNVRSGAGSDYDIVSRVSKGMRLPFLEEVAGWYKVSLPDGKVGWVWGELVSRVESETPDDGVSPTVPTSATVKASAANVRAGAGSAQAVVAQVVEGTILSILEEVDGWYRVRTPDGAEGWIWGDLIAISPPEATASAGGEFKKAQEVVVVAPLADIRSGVGSQEIVGQVAEGAILVVRGQEGGWYEVETPDGVVGWISGNLVAAVDAPPSTPSISDLGEAIVKTGMANLRSGPSREDEAVDRAEEGTKLILLAQSGDWYQVRLPSGKTGWISGNIVEIVDRKAGGSLSVRSQPTGARVYLDGDPIGETPLELSDVSVGSHEVRMEKDLYRDWTGSVVVEVGATATVVATLTESPSSIVVSSQPSEARVYIDDIFVATTPVEITNVRPGTYRVRVVKDGYQEWVEEVAIKGGEKPILEVTLEVLKKVGLSISSTPPGATIYIEDEEVGVTPLEDLIVDSGVYKLRLTLEAYQDWEMEVSASGDETVVIAATLERPRGKLSLASNPTGASVFLNGVDIGTTPILELELEVGEYGLEVSAEGYENWTLDIIIEANRTTEARADLIEIESGLSVTSIPSGASVYLGDDYLGTTPLEVDLPPPGRYELQLIMEGFKKWTTEITVSAPSLLDVKAELVEPKGGIIVTSEPPGASVYLNDGLSGTTPMETLSTPVGIYRLRVTKEGYQDWTGEAIIGDGQVAEFDLTLEKVIQEEFPGLPAPNGEGEITGFVSFSSDPLGAEVFLDGLLLGSTPYNDEFPTGEYSIRFSKEGYNDAERLVIVTGDKIGSVRVILEPFIALMSVVAEPSEASVYLDGTLMGAVPLDEIGVPVGDHQLRVSKAGYHDRVIQVRVGRNEIIIVNLMLASATGSLVVSSDPPEATVYLNDQFVGQTPLRRDDMPPGEYTLKIEKDGFKEKIKEIIVVEGRSVHYDVTF